MRSPLSGIQKAICIRMQQTGEVVAPHFPPAFSHKCSSVIKCPQSTAELCIQHLMLSSPNGLQMKCIVLGGYLLCAFWSDPLMGWYLF